MVSTIVALVVPWYSIGENRAVVTSILFLPNLKKPFCLSKVLFSVLPLPLG